jgi:hypothetical protein
VSDWFQARGELLGFTSDMIARAARTYERYGPIDHEIPTDHGIYFLIDAGEIVYIGKTLGISGRLAQHWLKKKFDSYWCFEGVPYEWLEYIEEFYIRRFRPRLNRRPISGPRDLDQIVDRLEEMALALKE